MTTLALIAGVSVMGLLMGLMISVGAYLFLAPLVLLIPGIFLLMRPDISLVLFAATVLVITGSVKYFLGLGQLQWALSGLGMGLLGYAMAQRMVKPPAHPGNSEGFGPLLLLWWSIILFTSAANSLGTGDWLVGLRIYLPTMGVFAYLAYCNPKPQLLKTVLLSMLAIAAIQWVVCLYQALVIVPARIAGNYPGSPWDSIVGTFGGEKFGGGESGSLGVYLSIMVGFALALKKHRQIAARYLAILAVTTLIAIALVESKVVALMIPLVCLIIYRDYARAKPVLFIGGASVIGILMLSLLTAYYYLYWQIDSNKGLIDALYDRMFYSFDSHFQASSVNLGRVKSLIFWWDQHALLDNPLTLLLGHGLASAVSQSSVIGAGAAAKMHNLMLDVTGISKLLWECGLLGSAVFISIFALGFWRARQLKNQSFIPPWHRAAMAGAEASMVLMPLSIFYEVTIVSSPPMQFLALFLLGYIAYWWRQRPPLASTCHHV